MSDSFTWFSDINKNNFSTVDTTDESRISDLDKNNANIITASVESIRDNIEDQLIRSGFVVACAPDCSSSESQGFKLYWATNKSATTGGKCSIIYLINHSNQIRNLIPFFHNAKKTDNIIVHIDSSACISPREAITLANTIRHCDATVIAVANVLEGIESVLVWLSAKVPVCGRLSLVRFRDSFLYGEGESTAQARVSFEENLRQRDQILDYFVEVGFLEKNELDNVIKKQKAITLFGENLKNRVKKVLQYKNK